MTHAKIFFSMFGDVHSLFVLIGTGFILSPEFIEGCTLWTKLIGAVLGVAIMFMTGYHKWLQIKNEKKK